MKIVVTIKQVIDPEMPASAFSIDPTSLRVAAPPNIAPVINGFDEQAVEAALRIREAGNDTEITVLSAGSDFIMDVVKKPLAMGADALVLVEDTSLGNDPDPSVIVDTLVAAIHKLGDVDLVLAGRQASDWDNAQVALGVAEALRWPAITLARRVDIDDRTVRVERVLPDGYEVVEAPLPAVVTVSNELGNPRYPNMRGIMNAKRIEPTIWDKTILGVEARQPALEIVSLTLPERRREPEMVSGDDDADAGRRLALRLREERIL